MSPCSHALGCGRRSLFHMDGFWIPIRTRESLGTWEVWLWSCTIWSWFPCRRMMLGRKPNETQGTFMKAVDSWQIFRKLTSKSPAILGVWTMESSKKTPFPERGWLFPPKNQTFAPWATKTANSWFRMKWDPLRILTTIGFFYATRWESLKVFETTTRWFKVMVSSPSWWLLKLEPVTWPSKKVTSRICHARFFFGSGCQHFETVATGSHVWLVIWFMRELIDTQSTQASFRIIFTSHDRRIPIFSATRPPPTLHYSTRILWLKGNQQGGIQVATPYLIVLRNRSSKQWYTSWHNPTKSCEALQLQVGALAFTYVWGWLGGLFLPPLWAVTETV